MQTTRTPAAARAIAIADARRNGWPVITATGRATRVRAPSMAEAVAMAVRWSRYLGVTEAEIRAIRPGTPHAD